MKTPITVTQVANEVHRTPSWIRQICRAHDIGVVIDSAVRLLSPEDVIRIKEVLSVDRRRKKS